MHNLVRSFLLLAFAAATGCDIPIPYKKEYEDAIRKKEQAERKLKQTQDALTAEKNAMKRLYTED